ncbi:hypothetical protein, partial [Escherichia coli]|uniref:hypothetical protein n=1 Tax=Escherichia coli TaxID=562 RepID=UPI003EE314D3
SVSHVKAMLPRNIMLKPSDQFMLLNRSVQPFPDVMPDRSRLFVVLPGVFCCVLWSCSISLAVGGCRGYLPC